MELAFAGVAAVVLADDVEITPLAFELLLAFVPLATELALTEP